MLARIYLAILLIRIKIGIKWNLVWGHWFDTLR